jgi:hypothetical protein
VSWVGGFVGEGRGWEGKRKKKGQSSGTRTSVLEGRMHTASRRKIIIRMQTASRRKNIIRLFSLHICDTIFLTTTASVYCRSGVSVFGRHIQDTPGADAERIAARQVARLCWLPRAGRRWPRRRCCTR